MSNNGDNGFHSVGTFCAEADKFDKRNKNLNDTQATLGGALFGFMRALAECPECPGHFRTPYNEELKPAIFLDWKYLVCRNCNQVWTHK